MIDPKKFKVIDLTHDLDEQVPSWSGSCGFKAEVKLDYDGGCRVQKYTMHAGIGNNIDAPVHFIPNGKTVGQIALSDLILVPFYVVDVSLHVDSSGDYAISCNDLVQAEERHGAIPEKALVAFHTCWSSRWENVDAYRNVDSAGAMHFPALKGEVADYLLGRKCLGIGVDVLSPDIPTDSSFPVHHKFLGAGKYIIENLANLEQAPRAGSWAVGLCRLK